MFSLNRPFVSLRQALYLLSRKCLQTEAKRGPKGGRKVLEKILIANRGEIACRIMKTAKRMGIRTVAVYSEADVESLHVSMADEAYLLGAALSSASYLNRDKIMAVALQSQSQAIHPGYGFLSENAEFAVECQEKGVTFIGPPASAIREMGIKSTSKAIMSAAGVPVVPGYHGENQEDAFLAGEANKIGFPVMIKAVRGGGGKGMRVAMTPEEFEPQLASARREALKSFGDQGMLIERFVADPRHVEVQVFGDTQGNYVYLFERDCSVQRRHQKIIEEAPGPGITPELRKQLGEAAVKAAKAVDYVGAGTIEFIFDPKEGKFFFMEMNTRLQVEHPVTEMITGTDLVEWQLRVASGEPLPLSQDQLRPIGHSFEARIYAEDPENEFMPGAGTLLKVLTPEPSSTLRVETGVRSGDEVSVHYDPMIAKLVVWEKDRDSALRKLRHALSQYNILGLKTNVDFLLRLASHPKFVEGLVYTNFITDHFSQLFPGKECSAPSDEILSAAAIGWIESENLLEDNRRETYHLDANCPFNQLDNFRLHGASYPSRRVTLMLGDAKYALEVTSSSHGEYNVYANGKQVGSSVSASLDPSTYQLQVNFNGKHMKKYRLLSEGENLSLFTPDSGSFPFEVQIPANLKSISESALGSSQGMVAPMPGVIEKVVVEKGQQVKVGDPLIVMIAMKMEYIIKAHKEATVKQILYKVGDNVPKGAKLVVFEE